MSFSLIEQAKIVKVLSPVDRTSTALPAVWVNMKNCERAYFIMETGVMTSCSAAAVTLYVANNASGTKNKAITSAGAAATLTMDNVWKRTISTDTLVKTTVTASTFNLVGTDDGKTFVIEVPANKMGTFIASSVTYDATHVRLAVATPGAHACLSSVLCIQTGLRYAEDVPPTAIT